MKITVLLPTYNRAEGFLQDAIHSYLDQDYDYKELIISDDGSKDNTREVVKYYQKKYEAG